MMPQQESAPSEYKDAACVITIRWFRARVNKTHKRRGLLTWSEEELVVIVEDDDDDDNDDDNDDDDDNEEEGRVRLVATRMTFRSAP